MSDDIRFDIDRDGIITHADARTARLLGMRAGKLEGSSLVDHVHLVDRVYYLSMLDDLRRGLASHPVEIRLRAVENGKHVFHSFRVEATGTAAAFMLLGRSLENERALLQEIALLKQELAEERSERDRLLATVSHELRTPLNAIIGFSDMLLHDAGDRQEGRKSHEYAGLIHRSGQYLLDVVNAVLDRARLENGRYYIEPQSFVFRESADMCAAIIEPQARAKGLVFEQHIDETAGELVADQRAVQQIVLNLAANAVKFTKPGGRVTVHATRVKEGDDTFLQISIADSGIGMKPEDIHRIGTPFMRANDSYTRAQEGSGLGLCLVKGLVDMHGGSIDFSSCPDSRAAGNGTLVSVRLPVAGPKSDELQKLFGNKDRRQLGRVIDMQPFYKGERQQGEWHNERQTDEKQEQDNAAARKTA